MAIIAGKIIIINQEGQTTPPATVQEEKKEVPEKSSYEIVKDGVLVKKYNKRSTYLNDMLPIDFEI